MTRGSAEDWTWPAELDALVAAPGTHRLLFQNETVRVLETRIAPGETTEVHTHRWPGVLYILSFDHFVRRDADGVVLLDSRTQGSCSFRIGPVEQCVPAAHARERRHVGHSPDRRRAQERLTTSLYATCFRNARTRCWSCVAAASS